MSQFVFGASAESAPGLAFHGDYGQNAVLAGPAQENCWAFRLHLFGGVMPGAGADSVIGMIWGGYDTPQRLSATSAIAVSTEFSGTAGGQKIEPLFTSGGTGYNSGYAWPLNAGDVLFAGYRTTLNRFQIGYRSTEILRELIQGNPSDAFAVAIRRNDVPAVCVAVFCEGNRQPYRAEGLSPANGATVTGTTPYFTALFGDPDTTYGDYLRFYHIQLTSPTALLWDRIYAADPAESAANLVSRPYEGSALATGGVYAWRVRVADHFSTWSIWSNQSLDGAGNIIEGAWSQITIASTVGSATLTTINGVASGKIESYAPVLAGTYSHPTGLAMANIQAQVFQGTTLVMVSGALAKSTANGGTWSATFGPEFGFVALQPGLAYSIQTRAQDTAGNWGPWLPLPARAITTNARPSTPANVTPSENRPFSQRPEIRFLMTDSDDTVATGLYTELEITRPDGTVVTRTPTLVSGTTDTWAYSTLAADLTIYGTYLIRARGRDGTIDGFWSTPAAFRYLLGPAVTITAPTAGQVIASNQPTITWSAVTNQAGYQVFIRDRATNVLVLDTGYRASTTALSYIPPTGVLHDNDLYTVSVWITLADTLTGYADRDFSVDYPTPAVLPNARGSVYAARLDGTDTTAALLSWEQPAGASTSTFWQYTVEQEEQGKPETRRILAQIPSITQVRFTDYEPKSGVVYVYRVWWEQIQGTDIRPSVVAEFTLTVNLKSTVIHLADEPEIARAHITYYDDRSFSIDPQTTYVPTWAGTLPTMVGHPSTSESVTIGFQMFEFAGQPKVRDQLARLDAIVYEVDGDGVKRPRMETVCVRTPRGDRVYGVVERMNRKDNPENGSTDVSLDVTLTNYRKPLASG